MALNIYAPRVFADPLDDLRHLMRGLPTEHRKLFERLVREHGPSATYAIPSKAKFVGNKAHIQCKVHTFRNMTRDECRAVLDMMLGKIKRDAEAAALAAEQEAIADRTYRNKDSDFFDPWRVMEERLGIKP